MSATGRRPPRHRVGRMRRPRLPLPPRRVRPATPGAGQAPPSAARSASAQYVVAHELRTPLTSLVVGSRILLGDSVNKARRREIVRDVAAEAQRLSDAVEDLLVLAGLEATAAVDPEPVSLQATLRAEIDRASRLVPELSVRTLLAADVPPIAADGGIVEHLVRNLVAVAVDAAGDRGLVEAILVEEPGRRIRVRVVGRLPRREATSVVRPAAPLRDVASRVLAERLGGTLSVATGAAFARAELLLPAGEGALLEGAVGERLSSDGTAGHSPAASGDAVTWV